VQKYIQKLSKYALYIAFIQAWTATLGSLFYSQIIGLTPCVLCWYQRILMYPLVILFTVAIIRKDKNIPYYVLPLTIIGIIIAAYQYLLQMTPLGAVELTKCDLTNPCSKIDAIYLGFITIPFMSIAAFLVISIMMIILIKSKKAK
jgi:disulfide bond formation protein DsbB